MGPEQEIVAPDTPKLLELADRLWVRQEIDNIGWADMGEFVLVVDALERSELEPEILAQLQKTVGDKPVLCLLNTHTHYDHIALNQVFRKRGARIINYDTESIPETGRTFGGGDRRALMLPLGGCHTREDCVVWFPNDGVLFVGDIFGWGLIPWDRILSAQKRDHILETYRRLIELGAVSVVPGHGPVCTTRELQRWVEYFEWLLERVSHACDQDLADEVIFREIVPVPDDMRSWWRFVEWKHEDSVKKILRAVRSNRL